jgi:DNA-binding transcriptional LysR family regulator
MDLATLAVFRTVAREQSITRAADLLGRAPSNVTTRIQQLEAEIGIALFQRETRRMELTEEGVTYLDYADRILNLAEEAQQVINPSEPTGVLRIGSMEATAATRLPIPLAAFNAKWSQVTIDLSTGPTRQLVDALSTRRIDCALIAIPSGEGWGAATELDAVPLFREELVLLLPPGHPQVESSDQIKPRALAAFAPGCSYRAIAQEWVNGFVSKPSQLQVQEVRSYHAMIACIAAGSCFSILPRSVLDLVPEAERFTIKPLTTVDTFLASRSGFGTPAFNEFRITLKGFSDFGDNRDAQ